MAAADKPEASRGLTISPQYSLSRIQGEKDKEKDLLPPGRCVCQGLLHTLQERKHRCCDRNRHDFRVAYSRRGASVHTEHALLPPYTAHASSTVSPLKQPRSPTRQVVRYSPVLSETQSFPFVFQASFPGCSALLPFPSSTSTEWPSLPLFLGLFEAASASSGHWLFRPWLWPLSKSYA